MTSIHSVLSCLSERRQNSASLEDALFMYSSNSTYVQIMYVHCTELGRAATVLILTFIHWGNGSYFKFKAK